MLRSLAKVLVVGVLALVAAVPTAYVTFVGDQRDVTIGAHEAVVSPTVDGWVGLDFGPVLPRMRLPADAPLGVGADIRLGDAEVDSIGEVVARDAAIASQPAGEIETIRTALSSMALDAVVRGLGVGVLVVLGSVLVWRAVGRARRRELATMWRRPGRRRVVSSVVTGVALIAAAALVATPRGGEPASTEWIPLGSAFPDVPDTDLLATVEVADSATTAGSRTLVRGALNIYRESLEFYGRLTDTAEQTVLRQPGENETTALVVSDRHDNIGMDPVARAIADQAEATTLIDLGDDTSSGAPWEAFSINSLAKTFRGFDVVGVGGNHDSGRMVTRQMADAGWTVLAGEGETVGGVRYIGASDPRGTGLAGYTDSKDANVDAVKDQDEQLTEAACADEEATVGVVHSMGSARELARSGCVDLILAGHLHYQVGPDVVVSDDGDRTTTLTMGTTGGAVLPIALGSQLRRDAQVTVVTFREGRPIGLQVVTFKPSGDIQVGDFTTVG